MPYPNVVNAVQINEALYDVRVEFTLSDGSRVISNIMFGPSWPCGGAARCLAVLLAAVEGVCGAGANIPQASRDAVVVYARGVLYRERVAALELPVWREVFGDDFHVFGVGDVYEDPHIEAFHRGLGPLTIRPLPERDVFAEVSGSSNYGPFSRIFHTPDQMVAYLKER